MKKIGWSDITDKSSAEKEAETIIPAYTGADKFWSDAARAVLAELLTVLVSEGKGFDDELEKALFLLDVDSDALLPAGSLAALYVSEGGRTRNAIYMTLASALVSTEIADLERVVVEQSEAWSKSDKERAEADEPALRARLAGVSRQRAGRVRCRPRSEDGSSKPFRPF